MINKRDSARTKFIHHYWNLNDDEIKWEFLLNMFKMDLVLVLDNDQTMVRFRDAQDDDPRLDNFENFIGDSEGVGLLLDAMGIQWEMC